MKKKSDKLINNDLLIIEIIQFLSLIFQRYEVPCNSHEYLAGILSLIFYILALFAVYRELERLRALFLIILMGNTSIGRDNLDTYIHPRLGRIRRLQEEESDQFIEYEITI